MEMNKHQGREGCQSTPQTQKRGAAAKQKPKVVDKGKKKTEAVEVDDEDEDGGRREERSALGFRR